MFISNERGGIVVPFDPLFLLYKCYAVDNVPTAVYELIINLRRVTCKFTSNKTSLFKSFFVIDF